MKEDIKELISIIAFILILIIGFGMIALSIKGCRYVLDQADQRMELQSDD